MNEELLRKLYDKYGLSSKGTFEQFATDMGNPEVQRKFYNKYGLSEKGSFESFQSDLGLGATATASIGAQAAINDGRTVGEFLKDTGIRRLNKRPASVAVADAFSVGRQPEQEVIEEEPTVKDAGFWESLGKRFWNTFGNRIPKQFNKDVLESIPDNYDKLVETRDPIGKLLTSDEEYFNKRGILTPEKIRSTPLDTLLQEYSVRQDPAGRDTYQILQQAKQLKTDNPELVLDFYKSKVNSIIKGYKDQFKEEKVTKQEREEQELMKNVPTDLGDFGLGYVGGALGEGLSSTILFTVNMPLVAKMEKSDVVSEINSEKAKIYKEKFGVDITPEDVAKLEGDEEGIANTVTAINMGLEGIGILSGAGKAVKTMFFKKAQQELTKKAVQYGMKSALKDISTAALAEGATEFTQDVNVQIASKMAAGKSLIDAIAEVDFDRAFNAFVKGALPGGMFGTITATSNKINNINQAINETTTGNPAVDLAQNEILNQELNAQTVRSDEGQVPQTGDVVQTGQDQGGQNIQQQTQETSDTQEQVTEPQEVTQQPVGEQPVADIVEQETAPGVSLAKEFLDTGVLLGISEESTSATKATASEQLADFLRSKKTNWTRQELDAFMDEFNSISSRPLTNAEVTAAHKLLGEVKTPPVKITTTLRDQYKQFLKGWSTGLTDSKRLVKDMGNALSDLIGKQKLSQSQQNTILKRATSVNFTNPVMVERLLNYVDNVVQDQAYSQRVGKTKSKVRDIRGKMKKGRFASVSPMVDRITQLDPESLSLQDLAVYESVLEELDKKIPNVKPLKDNIEGLLSRSSLPEQAQTATTPQQLREFVGGIEQVTDYESFSDAKRKINAAKKRLYQLAKSEAINAEEAEVFAMEIDNLDDSVNQKAEEFSAQAEAFKQGRVKSAKELLNNLPEYSKQDSEQIAKFKAINADNLTPQQAEDYFQIAEGLTNGFINKSLYDLVSKANKSKLVKTYQGIAEAASKEFDKQRKFFGLWNVKLNPIKDSRKLLDELKLLHAQRWDRKFLLGKEKPIYTKVFKPIIDKVRKTEVEINKAQKAIKEAVGNLNNKQRVKVGMLLSQLDYENSIYAEGKPKDKWRYLLNEYPDRQNNAYFDAKSVFELRELERYRSTWEAMPKDSNGDIDVNAAVGKLTPQEKKAFEGVSEILNNEDFRGKVKVITEMRGEIYDPHDSYFTNYVRQRVRKGKDQDKSTDSFVDDMLSLDKKGLGVRSGRTYQRTGELYFTELDIAKVANRTVEEVNRDYFLSEVIRDNMGSLNITAETLEGDMRGAFDAMYQAMKHRVITEYNLKSVNSDAVNDFINWYLGFRRFMALSNPMRMPPELLANVLRQGIAVGFNSEAFTHKGWAELMKDTDSIVTGRVNKYASESVRASETKSGEIADSIIGQGDAPVVRISFVTSFTKRFKELTGEKFNLTEYTNNPEYRNKFKDQIYESSGYADSLLQDLFNAQITFNAPSATRIAPKTPLVEKTNVFAKMFGFMQSFNTSETAEFMYSLRDLAYGTNDGRVAAARRIASLGVSNYAYINGMLFMFNLLRAPFDEEKELGDLLAEQFSPRKQFEILLASLGSLVMSRYGNLVRPIATLMVSGLYQILKKSDFENKSELKADLDAIKDISNTMLFTGEPINFKADRAEKIAKLFPAIGDALADGIVLGETIVDLVHKDPETMSDEERATYDMLILVNKTAAFMYKNPASPTIERLLKAAKYGVKKEKTVDLSPEPLDFIIDLPEPPQPPEIPEPQIPELPDL